MTRDGTTRRSSISKTQILKELRPYLEEMSRLDGVTSIGVTHATGGGSSSRGTFLKVMRETETAVECEGYQGPCRQRYFVHANRQHRSGVIEYVERHFGKNTP